MKEIKCLLCLECPTIPECRFLNIFSEEGLEEDITNIINKYFWIKLCSASKDEQENQQICSICWKVLKEFHLLYQKVEQAHNNLNNYIAIDDPLPLDVLLKSELSSGCRSNNAVCTVNANIFDAELKIEIDDLDSLPRLEIIEKIPAATVGNESAKCTQRSKLLGIDTELTKSQAGDNSINFPNTSVPFVDLSLNADESMAPVTNVTKKRGRPRRSDVADKDETKNYKKSVRACKTKSVGNNQSLCESSTEVVEFALSQTETETTKNEEPTSELQNVQITETGKQIFDDNDENDDNDDDKDFQASGSSSENNSDSDADAPDLFDKKRKTDKYAVIYKKPRPKKYKKHDKSEKQKVKHLSEEKKAALRAEMEEHDRIIKEFFKVIRCPKCEILVNSFSDLLPHFRIDHKSQHRYLVCCGRQFPRRHVLVDHIMVHANPEHFKCKTCEQIFPDAKKLKLHEQSHLPNAPAAKETIQCDICLKKYISKNGLKHHLLSIHVPKEEHKFECSECDKRFATRAERNTHVNRVHEKAYSTICDKCGKYFLTKHSLKKHEGLEHSETPKPKPVPEQCKLCGVWLSHALGLKIHMKNIHESENADNKCKICGFVSTTPRALKKHIHNRHVRVKNPSVQSAKRCNTYKT